MTGRSKQYLKTLTVNARFNRLSLFQRERTKVRDRRDNALRARARSLEGHCPALPKLDDSKIESREFLLWREIPLVHDHAFHEVGTRVLNRPTRWRVWRQDNRNRVCKDRWDAVAGIYNRRNFGSVDGARGFARIPSPFCEADELGSQKDHLPSNVRAREAKLFESGRCYPLTSILSPQPGRGGSAHPNWK